jgi:nuclease-like protein
MGELGFFISARNGREKAATVLAFGKEVTIQIHGQDKYKRTLADVFLLDGSHVNHTLVKEGWCWWYRKYAPGDTVLEGLEKEAREAKKGLWIDPAPIPPWVYRKAKRGQSLDLSDLVPLKNGSESNLTSRGPPQLVRFTLNPQLTQYPPPILSSATVIAHLPPP